MQNGYASATGQQYLPSSSASRLGAAPGMDIETTLRSLGVTWMRKVRTYGVAKMAATLKEAMRTAERGLKVIIADGECQLARQRRVRAEDAEKLKRGERVTKTRYGVDDAICTGDHSCIRLSGCPSLTVKPNPDPLRTDPVATVIESCVGCGLCGEVAHAAVLCPSFYRAEVVRNPGAWDRLLYAVRTRVISMFGGTMRGSVSLPPCGERDGEGGATAHSEFCCHPPPHPSPSRGEGADESGRAAAAATDHQQRPITLLIAALGGEGGGVLTNWIVSAAESQDFPVQSTSIPGVAQRTGATTYYIEIMPVVAARRRHAAGAGARARRRRRRRDDGERADGSRPRRQRRVRHARPHAVDRIDLALAGDEREDRDGRRPLRLRPAGQGDRGEFQGSHPDRHGSDRAAHRRVHQFGDARHHRRHRPAADPGRGVRGRDPRRRQGRRRQPAWFPRRARSGAEAGRCDERRS